MQTVVVVFVSAGVALFGVTSAVLGFIAEGKRLTRDQIYVFRGECVYPANGAHMIGICAIFQLAVAQIIASAARGRSCCRRPPPGSVPSYSTRRRGVVGVLACVLSWVAALIAAIFYWVAVRLNTPRRTEAIFGGPNVEYCPILKDGIFVKAAVLRLSALVVL